MEIGITKSPKWRKFKFLCVWHWRNTNFIFVKCRTIMEANEENKTKARSLKTFIYSTSYRQKQQLFVLLQVLKEIREVRAIMGKTGRLGWSIFVGEGPHVLMALNLFTKVSIGQCTAGLSIIGEFEKWVFLFHNVTKIIQLFSSKWK